MKAYRWIVITVLVLSLGFQATTVNAAPLQAGSASLTLTSSALNPVMIGGEIAFDLSVSVANVTPGVAGIDLYLSYDPTLVAPPDTPGAAAAEVLPDFFGVSNFSINEVLSTCPVGAAGPCVHLVLAGPPQTYQSGVAARFHFRALAVGPAGSPGACFVVAQSNMVDANGFQVAHTPAQQLCRPIQGRDTTGVIQRQGVPGIPNAGGGTLACSNVTATGTWPFGPVQTNVSGNFTLSNLPNGTYTLRAVYPGYLPAVKTGVVIANNALAMDVGTTTLRGGDVNGDGVVNILDIGAIISKFGRPKPGLPVLVRSATPASCGADEAADINDDGLVNISDLAIAAGNWGLVGPTNWP